MTSKLELSFFILGATGYIGGAIAVEIKKRYPSSSIQTYTRAPSKAAALKRYGFQPVSGRGGPWSQDRDVLFKAIAESDVVINAADADDLELTRLVLAGLKASSKRHPILLHTSGTGLFLDFDNLKGAYGEDAEKRWDDNSLNDIKSIHGNQPHRNVDAEIFDQSRNASFISYVIAPATIYGVADKNPGHKTSSQIPILLRASIEHKQAVHGGPGTNIWNNVHYKDMVSLYLLLLERALDDRRSGRINVSDPESRFYVACNDTHVWKDVSIALGKALYAAGLVSRREAISVDASTLHPSVTSNSNAVANRAFKDGWKPAYPGLSKDYLRWVTEDVKAYQAGY